MKLRFSFAALIFAILSALAVYTTTVDPPRNDQKVHADEGPGCPRPPCP